MPCGDAFAPASFRLSVPPFELRRVTPWLVSAMNPDNHAPWEALFPSAVSAKGWRLHFRLARKHGYPLLLVPSHRRSAGTSLALYPAQTRFAKLARGLLGLALEAGLPWGTEPLELRLDPETAFMRFLFPSAAGWEDAGFAVLCGNPLAPGRRFILLVIDQGGQPQRLIKAGVGEPAAKLIRAEVGFLESQPAELLNAPAVIGRFRGDDIEAVAVEYAPGDSPATQDIVPLAQLLRSWLRTDRRTRCQISNLAALAAVCQTPDLLRSIEARLGSAQFCPAIYHGDLAPWNVRVNPITRRWVVLDWERGEPLGPPGWDWFHFLIQHEVLARRTPPPQLAARVNRLLHSSLFAQYAAAAGITACAHSLLLAYVLYWRDVLRPADGAGKIEALIRLLSAR